MNVKEAVELAKKHILELFAEEGISNVGLEEVEYDELQAAWHITIGFSRPWDHHVFEKDPRRSYKVVNIGDDGQVRSVKNRETSDAC